MTKSMCRSKGADEEDAGEEDAGEENTSEEDAGEEDTSGEDAGEENADVLRWTPHLCVDLVF